MYLVAVVGQFDRGVGDGAQVVVGDGLELRDGLVDSLGDVVARLDVGRAAVVALGEQQRPVEKVPDVTDEAGR